MSEKTLSRLAPADYCCHSGACICGEETAGLSYKSKSVVSGHSPSNWQTQYRWRFATWKEALGLDT